MAPRARNQLSRRRLLQLSAGASLVSKVLPALAMAGDGVSGGTLTQTTVLEAGEVVWTNLSPAYQDLAQRLRLAQALLQEAEKALDERMTPEFLALADDPNEEISNKFYFDPYVFEFVSIRSALYAILRRALRPSVVTKGDCAFQEHCERVFANLMDSNVVAYESAIDGPKRRHARDLVRARGNDRLEREAADRLCAELKHREQVLKRRPPRNCFA